MNPGTRRAAATGAAIVVAVAIAAAIRRAAAPGAAAPAPAATDAARAPSPTTAPFRAPRPTATAPAPAGSAPASEARPDATTGAPAPDGGPRAIDLTLLVLAAEDGSPLRGATVRFLGAGGADGADASATTGADGLATLRGIPNGNGSCAVEASGRMRAGIHLPVEATAGAARQEVRLRRSREIRGVVLGLPDRRPVAGAHLAIVPASADALAGRSGKPLRFIVTGADGRFHTEGLDAAIHLRVNAGADGHARVTTSVPPAEAGASDDASAGIEADGFLTIELPRAGVVRGRVVSPDGAPVERVTVWALGPAQRSELRGILRGGSPTGGDLLSVRTDADGTFTLHTVPAEVEHTLVANDGERSISEPVSGVRAPPGEGGVTVDLVMGAAPRLHVRVLRPDGTPLRGPFRVHLFDDIGFRGEEGRDGEVTIDRLHPGSYTLVVEAGDFAGSVARVVVARGAITEAEVCLQHGRTISGTVTNDAGTGIEGAEVSAGTLSDSLGLAGTGRSAKTDAAGRFEITGLAPGRHGLTLWEPDGRYFSAGEADAPSAGLRLRVSGSVRFSFAADPERLLPVRAEDIVVTARRLDDGSWYGLHMPPIADGHEAMAADRLAGRLEFHGAPPAEIEVYVRVPGFAPVVRRTVVPSGAAADLGSVALDAGATVEGRVVDEAGRPVRGVGLSITQFGREPAGIVLTGPAGAFAFPRLAPGPATIRSVESRSGTPAHAPVVVPVQVKADSGPVTVVLREAVVVRGRVLHPDGRPAPLVAVTGLETGAEEEAAHSFDQTDESGAFSARVHPGTWEFRVHSLTMREVVARTVVTVAAGGEPEVELRLDD